MKPEDLCAFSSTKANGFDCFVTTDQNLKFEQNLTRRRLAIVVLPTTDWRLIRAHTDGVAAAVAAASAGDYVEVTFSPSGDRAEE